jgi:hypothetical protein
MAEPARCPRCRHENPPENRFCGWCGASLESSHELVPRREETLRALGDTLPVKTGPVSKALAVGLATLAVRAGLSWLRHGTTPEDHSPTSTTGELDTAVSERLLAQSLQEVLVQELEGEHRGRVLAWRAVRSIIITESTDMRR